MRPFNKLLVASFKQFFRDKVALFFTFAFPLLFMIIFGLVFSGENDVSYDVGLVNQDDSVIGMTFAESIQKVTIFKVSEGALDDMLAEFKRGDLRAVIQIPADLQSAINSGNVGEIIVYYDPSQTTSSQVILSVLDQMVSEANHIITQQPVVLKLTGQSIQARNLRNIDYLVPGILAMSVLFLGLFGALPMVEWREKQVLKRLGATPLRRSTIVLSQVAYRLVLAVIQSTIIIAVAYFAFHVKVVGSWALLFGIVILGTLAFVSLGYLAVSRARTTESAMPIIQLIQFPMLFLSGVFFPVDFMPGFMRPIVNALPLTYLGDALRQVMVEATPLHSMVVNIAVLAGWLVVSMVLAIRFFRWE